MGKTRMQLVRKWRRELEIVQQLLQPYKSFVMVFAWISRKNHAKPSQ